MTESTTDRSHGNSLGEQPGGGEVPQVVQTDRVKTHGPTNPDEALRDIVGRQWPVAVGVRREDVGGIAYRRAAGVGPLAAPSPVALELQE